MTELQQLDATIAETKRFLARAQEWRRELKTLSGSVWTSPLRAAAERASMDLTRELARFRRH